MLYILAALLVIYLLAELISIVAGRKLLIVSLVQELWEYNQSKKVALRFALTITLTPITLLVVVPIIPFYGLYLLIGSFFPKKVKYVKNFFDDVEYNNDLNTNNIKYFALNLEAAYEPSLHDLIFVDRVGNESFVDYMRIHDDDFRKFVYSHNYRCCFLDRLADQLLNEGTSIGQYYSPTFKEDFVFPSKTNLQDEMLSMLIGKRNVEQVKTGFLSWNPDKKQYIYYEILPAEQLDYQRQVNYCVALDAVKFNSLARYRKITKENLDKEEWSDFTFDDDINNIVEELKEKIGQLQQSGVSDYIIRQLVIRQTPDAFKVSRLKVKRNFDIVLVDYDDMVIEMTPLAKAVYLLFLKHQEGIFLKDMSDYKEELVKIYNRLTGRTDADKIGQTLNDLVNPMKNRLNENCTRIREAFVSKIEENLAKNYYVHGPWRERKKIDLPRDMVEWEE